MCSFARPDRASAPFFVSFVKIKTVPPVTPRHCVRMLVKRENDTGCADERCKVIAFLDQLFTKK
jgi:hypothetical protein